MKDISELKKLLRDASAGTEVKSRVIETLAQRLLDLQSNTDRLLMVYTEAKVAAALIHSMLRDGEWYCPEEKLNNLMNAIERVDEGVEVAVSGEDMEAKKEGIVFGTEFKLAEVSEGPSYGELVKKVEHLEEFKRLTHQRLDDLGVPADPVPGAACRMGARFDALRASQELLADKCQMLNVDAMRVTCEELANENDTLRVEISRLNDWISSHADINLVTIEQLRKEILYATSAYGEEKAEVARLQRKIESHPHWGAVESYKKRMEAEVRELRKHLDNVRHGLQRTITELDAGITAGDSVSVGYLPQSKEDK